MPRKKSGRTLFIRLLLFSLVFLVSCSPIQNSFIRTPSMLAPQGPVAGSIAGLSWFMVFLGSLIYIGVMIYFSTRAAGIVRMVLRQN